MDELFHPNSIKLVRNKNMYHSRGPSNALQNLGSFFPRSLEKVRVTKYWHDGSQELNLRDCNIQKEITGQKSIGHGREAKVTREAQARHQLDCLQVTDIRGTGGIHKIHLTWEQSVWEMKSTLTLTQCAMHAGAVAPKKGSEGWTCHALELGKSQTSLEHNCSVRGRGISWRSFKNRRKDSVDNVFQGCCCNKEQRWEAITTGVVWSQVFFLF